MTRSRPAAIVFDMGGVLVELGPVTDIVGGVVGGIVGDDPVDADRFWTSWLASPAVREFEMGRCAISEFGDRLVAELGLAGSGTELVDRFRAWPRGLFPRAAELLAELGAADDPPILAVLSNTNQLHWHHQIDGEILRPAFDRCYLSFELAMAKPDPDIFEHVIADLACEPDRIVFFDDNQPNVDTARSLGIDAHLVRGPDQARSILFDRGVVGGGAVREAR